MVSLPKVVDISGEQSQYTMNADDGRKEAIMAKPNIAEKDVLNPEEAIWHWNLSRRKFYRFLTETDGGDFLVYYGERKLIIRTAFDRYLTAHHDLKEAMANGKSRKRADQTRLEA